MCKKTLNLKALKTNKSIHGKRGFTLVELCTVMALVGILGTMVITFYTMSNSWVKDSKASYEYLEDHAALKEELCFWSAEKDTTDSIFFVGADGALIVAKNGVEYPITFADGVLSLGDVQKAHLDEIDGISFSSNEKIIKCITYRYDKNGKRTESCFVFSPRSATIIAEDGGNND